MDDIKAIGIIHSPHTDIKNMPIQPKGAKGIKGHILVKEEYTDGLKDLDGFSHLYLLYHFHQAGRMELIVTPFMDKNPRGVFATRSPLRPNHIGLSIVHLTTITGNRLDICDVDILDGTPLLDIKPYIHNFDAVADSTSGWMTASEQAVAAKRSDSRFK
jgi:tRNA (adenine37-N6)-methyltransferase